MNDAVKYAEADFLQKRDTRETLAEYIDRISWASGDLVLDIGCGPGKITADVLLPILPTDIGKIVGIDMSNAMVKYAEANHRHPKLCFAQMDIATKHLNKEMLREMTDTKIDIAAKNLNKDKLGEMTDNYSRQRLEEGIFNKVFSFFCLHWVQDQKQAFKNMYELMKCGGEGLVIFLSNNATFEVYEVLAETPKWNPYMKDARCHISPYHKSKDPSAEVSEVLRHAGFQVITCINGKRCFPFESVSHFKKFIEAIDPFMERIPEHLRDAYLNDCISAFGKIKPVEFLDPNNLNEDGHVVYYELIIAHFKKVPSVAPSTNEAIKKMGYL